MILTIINIRIRISTVQTTTDDGKILSSRLTKKKNLQYLRSRVLSINHNNDQHYDHDIFSSALTIMKKTSNNFVVGSSPQTSSPTFAEAIAALMPGQGLVTWRIFLPIKSLQTQFGGYEVKSQIMDLMNMSGYGCLTITWIMNLKMVQLYNIHRIAPEVDGHA